MRTFLRPTLTVLAFTSPRWPCRSPSARASRTVQLRLPVDKPPLEVLLTTGIREWELAAVFDTYGQSLAVETRAVGLDGTPIQSPVRADFRPAGHAHRGRPAGRARRRRGREARRRPILTRVPVPFDAVLQDLVRTTDTTTWPSTGEAVGRGAGLPQVVL
ncbi:hypothetical protein AB0E54_14985 [Amycolatopsis coloradensis]|nr:hypothetical protein [Amycolatopsis coloradensis]